MHFDFSQHHTCLHMRSTTSVPTRTDCVDSGKCGYKYKCALSWTIRAVAYKSGWGRRIDTLLTILGSSKAFLLPCNTATWSITSDPGSLCWAGPCHKSLGPLVRAVPERPRECHAVIGLGVVCRLTGWWAIHPCAGTWFSWSSSSFQLRSRLSELCAILEVVVEPACLEGRWQGDSEISRLLVNQYFESVIVCGYHHYE